MLFTDEGRHVINVLQQEKTLHCKSMLLTEFPNRNRSRGWSESFSRKNDKFGSVDQLVDSGRRHCTRSRELSKPLMLLPILCKIWMISRTLNSQ